MQYIVFVFPTLMFFLLVRSIVLFFYRLNPHSTLSRDRLMFPSFPADRVIPTGGMEGVPCTSQSFARPLPHLENPPTKFLFLPGKGNSSTKY